MIVLALLQDVAAEESSGFTLAWVDWVAVVLGGVFLLLGILRGLWWQVMRFVGILAAAALARTFADGWGARLQEVTDLSIDVSVGIVWVALFVLGIVLTALLGTLGKRSLEAMQLGLMDRAGGALAGALTGLFLHVALLVVLAYLGPQPWTSRTLEGTFSRSLLQFATTRHNVLAKGETESSLNLHQWLGSDGTNSPRPPLEAEPDPSEGPQVQ